MNVRNTLIGAALALFPALAIAQPLNNQCLSAFVLTNVQNYCSAPGEFTNEDATVSTAPLPFCFPNPMSGDV